MCVSFTIKWLRCLNSKTWYFISNLGVCKIGRCYFYYITLSLEIKLWTLETGLVENESEMFYFSNFIPVPHFSQMTLTFKYSTFNTVHNDCDSGGNKDNVWPYLTNKQRERIDIKYLSGSCNASKMILFVILSSSFRLQSHHAQAFCFAFAASCTTVLNIAAWRCEHGIFTPSHASVSSHTLLLLLSLC